MADAGDLHALAVEFLAACEEALDTVPTDVPGLGGAPARSFVDFGTPVFDFASAATDAESCDQLTVHVSVVSEGHRPPKADIARINLVSFVATIARCCAPTVDSQGNSFSPAIKQAEQVNADKWALWNYIWNKISEGMLFDKCGQIQWGGLAPLNPSGGCAGSVLSINVSLDGYQTVFGT
jgi:hypothetical protein